MVKPKFLGQLLGVIVLASSSAVGAMRSGPCIPLAAVSEANCPANWAGVPAAKAAWCGQPRAEIINTYADVSTGQCRGFLRYHRAGPLDSGHSYCLYDPSNLALRGHYWTDPKAELYGITCGTSKEDFDDKECERVSCRGLIFHAAPAH